MHVSVGWSVCPHVFSRTVAVVDTKRGYLGMCSGRSAQQESGVALSKNTMFTGGGRLKALGHDIRPNCY